MDNKQTKNYHTKHYTLAHFQHNKINTHTKIAILKRTNISRNTPQLTEQPAIQNRLHYITTTINPK
ncbi:hypothetical protein GCM10020220_012810 [Nonomuraea rubra]